MAKHYIIVGATGSILRGFSSDFEQPDEDAICICEDGGRHFELNGVVNPPMMDMQGRYRYKLVDGVVVERTQEELASDVLPAPMPSEAERLAAVEAAVLDLVLGGEIGG